MSFGLAVGVVIAFVAPWQLSVLVGWDVTALLLVTWVAIAIGRLDAAKTAEFASSEDNSRGTTRLLIVAACVVTLPGVAFALALARDLDGPMKSLLTGASVLTVMSSWALVHVTFMLRYADLYFTDTPGGVDFPNEDHPDFSDFAYLAFTIGMTFQVSDTNIERRSIRRAIFRHALLSYLFGAVIVGVTINVIAGLFN